MISRRITSGKASVVSPTIVGNITAGSINNQSLQNNFSTASQAVAATTRTYITGSGLTIVAGTLRVGTRIRWVFDVTKTAAGTAASTLDIAVGTNGTTADTARVSFTKPAGTAAVDCGRFVVEAIVRSIGATCVIVGHMSMTHNLTSTGLATIPCVEVTTVGSSFNVSSATKIGLCLTTGASDAYTIQTVSVETWNV